MPHNLMDSTVAEWAADITVKAENDLSPFIRRELNVISKYIFSTKI